MTNVETNVPVVDAERINTIDLTRRADPHYIFTIDPETGEEIKVERLDEFSQETEDEVTVH